MSEQPMNVFFRIKVKKFKYLPNFYYIIWEVVDPNNTLLGIPPPKWMKTVTAKGNIQAFFKWLTTFPKFYFEKIFPKLEKK